MSRDYSGFDLTGIAYLSRHHFEAHRYLYSSSSSQAKVNCYLKTKVKFNEFSIGIYLFKIKKCVRQKIETGCCNEP